MNITSDASCCQSTGCDLGHITILRDHPQISMMTDMVNTFLPYASFSRSAIVLDRARLGKQRVEVMQILSALHGETQGYMYHPATIMWRGYEAALCNYGLYICDEWIGRGYKDTCRDKIRSYFPFAQPTPAKQMRDVGLLPWWFGWKAFHESHRSNLLRKSPDHYGIVFWESTPNMPYVWPGEKRNSWKAQHAKGSPYGP